MGRTAKGNDDLLIIGGAGLLAVLLFSGVLNKSSGSSGSESVEVPWSGSGDTSPTIYQIPAEAGVTFPTSDNTDLAALLAGLLGSGGTSTGNDTGTDTPVTTKKSAATVLYDAGQVTETGDVIKTPFVAKTGESSPWWDSALKAAPSLLGGVTLLTNPATAALGASSLMLNVADFAGVTPGGAASTKKEAATASTQGNGTRFGADSTWPTYESAGAELAATKKEALTGGSESLGMSGQYVRDPGTGLLKWTGVETANGEFAGLNSKGEPYQRDIDILGPGGQTLYDATTKKGDPMFGIDASQSGGGTVGVYPGLSQAEKAMTYQKYVGKNWVSLPIANTSYSVLNSTKKSSKSRVTTRATRTTTVKKSSSASTVRIGGSSGFGGGGAGGR